MAMNPIGTMLGTAVSTAMAAGQAAAAAKKNNSTSKGSSKGTSGGSASNSNQITYRDLDGNSYTGYLKDGVTYQDAAMTKPVSSNSVVNTAGGTYLKTDAGSLKAGTPEYDAYVANYMAKKNQPKAGNYDDLVRELEAASLESSLNALKSAYDKNVSTLQAEQERLAPMYQNARNQEAADSALSRQRFNETAAAYGLNSGTAGQANLSYATQLQSDLSALQAAETAANQEIERQRSDLAIQYQNAIAQAKADNNMQLAQQLYNEAIRREEALQQQSQYNSQTAMQWYQMMLDKYNQDRNYDYTVSQNQREDALNAAALAAQLGDYSLFGKYYNWDDEFTRQMNQKYAAAQAGSGRGSGGGTGGNLSADTAGNAQAAYDAGVRNLVDAIAYYKRQGFGDSLAKDMAESYMDMLNDGAFQQQKQGIPKAQDNGNGSSYTTAWSQARKMYDQGRSEKDILNYLDQFDEGQLTDKGLDYIMTRLNLGGYREG